tara:strand:- start:1178 stop:1690 length:513 start_codon:yes stop_codon:yes gene_type:complete
MIFLGIGSNLQSSFGDRFENIKLAISHLEKSGIQIIKQSSFYETLSYPNKKNPKFINVVVSVDAVLKAEDLMSLLISIEEKLERKRRIKNDPRTCDIDIIDYKGEVINFQHESLNLQIPHEKINQRNFVLFPLKEIFPKWKHPKTNENISALIENLPEEDRKSILKIEKY